LSFGHILHNTSWGKKSSYQVIPFPLVSAAFAVLCPGKEMIYLHCVPFGDAFIFHTFWSANDDFNKVNL